MKRKKIQLLAVSLVLIVTLLMSQSGITVAIVQTPSKILSDTLVGEDPFIETLELVAAEDTALIAQYYQLNGERQFPLNPAHSAFNKLDLLYIVSSNQENWQDYWPRSIWEFRDGATIILQFSQGMEDSLDDADQIVSEIGVWMNTTIDVIYGAEINGVTTLFYWGYMSSENHSNFITNEFYDVLKVGGYTNFITNEVITSAPISVVGTGLVRDETSKLIPLAVVAFVLENGISIDGNDVHTMSIGDAFDFSGTIQPAPNSIISHIEFRLPYVANVYDSSPNTNNLYPELTGRFEWTLKYGTLIDLSYNDIHVTYDMAVEELETFPQITSELDVNVTALHDDFKPMLNYTIDMTNTGDETAHNVNFTWDLEEKPKPEYITVFDNDTYEFNDTVERWWNYTSGKLVVNKPTKPVTFPFSLHIKGWFTYRENDTIVQPIYDYNIHGHNLYHFNFTESYNSVHINKSFFNFKRSSNLNEITLSNGNFALNGSIAQLDPSKTETFWWSISDLPAKNDSLVILNFPPQVDNDTIYDYNVTFSENNSAYSYYGNNLADFFIRMALDEGESLRFPPVSCNPEIIPGVMFRYEDSASREYFGWSNGLIIQLYDDEAILKTTVSLNSSIYKIDEVAQIDVAIENIGDTPATNVQVQGFHAQLGPDWEVIGISNFSAEEQVGTINPGQTVTHTFIRDVSTFLGLHPVVVAVDFTTEEDEGYNGPMNRTDITNVASNLILGIVLPKDDKAGEDEPSYPTPVVDVSVSWIDENGDKIENGDIIEIKTEIKNLGDEATTIKVFSYFPTRMASIDPYARYYDGYNYKVTDISGNVIDPDDYDQAFAFDHPDWPITIAAVEGLHLAPGATIIFYYKLNVTDANSLILPPVAVEYDSRYPMAGTSGMEGASEADGGSSPIASRMSPQIRTKLETSGIRLGIQAGSSSSNSWTSTSGASVLAAYAALPEDTNGTGVSGFTALTGFIRDNMQLMIVVLAIPVVILVYRESRRSKK